MKLCTLAVVATLAVPSVVFPNAARAQPKEEGSELTGDPDIESVLEVLRKRNTVKRSEIVTRYVTEYRRYWCRSGLFGRHRRLVTKCVRIPVYEHRIRERPGLEQGIGWDDLSDPRLGFSEDTITLNMLPKAAAGRASRIKLICLPKLPQAVDSQVLLEDRVLVIAAKSFSRQGAPAGKERAYRIEAKVKGPKDADIRLAVKVQQRSVGGINDQDKAALNQIAIDLWKDIQAELIQ